MNNLKNKNIFNNFEYSKNNLTIKNIETSFGKRIVDLLIQLPVSIFENNLIIEIKASHIETTVTCELFTINYEKRFNRRSPFKIICENNVKQKVEILRFNMNEQQLKN